MNINELRHRLDSLEIAIQTRKRSGSPIDDLEKYAAALRDSLAELRETASTVTYEADSALQTGGAFWDNIVFPDWLQSFQPHNMFDWIIVITGLAAILAGIVLMFGLIISRNKKHHNTKKKPTVRKMNLAPTSVQPAVNVQSAPNRDSSPHRTVYEPEDIAAPAPLGAIASANPMASLQSLLADINKMAPPPPNEKQSSHRVAGNYNPQGHGGYESNNHAHHKKDARGYSPDNSSFHKKDSREADRVELMPSKAIPPRLPQPRIPEPEPEPEALIAEAPELLPPFTGGKPSGNAFNINDLVITASKNGLSEQEISKRYQISADQVRLILRMAK